MRSPEKRERQYLAISRRENLKFSLTQIRKKTSLLVSALEMEEEQICTNWKWLACMSGKKEKRKKKETGNNSSVCPRQNWWKNNLSLTGKCEITSISKRDMKISRFYILGKTQLYMFTLELDRINVHRIGKTNLSMTNWNLKKGNNLPCSNAKTGNRKRQPSFKTGKRHACTELEKKNAKRQTSTKVFKTSKIQTQKLPGTSISII